MSTTQPIRQMNQVNQLKNYYFEQHPNLRNYTLITFGLNTALRISDILSLRWNDVYDFAAQTFHLHLMLFEQKTGNYSSILLNPSILQALTLLMKQNNISEKDYIFHSFTTSEKPLSRFQAYRIIKDAAQQVGIEETIGCHSMRKTFGYHAWKKGVQPAMLMNIYNHSSYIITKRYLGIDQDDRDEVFLKIQF